MDPIVAPVPTAPTTNSPFSGGTQGPSVSAQPSTQPPTIKGKESISSPSSPSSIETPSGDLDNGDAKAESLSAGGIAGIVLASVLVAYVALYAYATKKRKREGDDPDLSDMRNKDLEAGLVAEKKDHLGRDQDNKEYIGGEDAIEESISNSPGKKSNSSDTRSFQSKGSDDVAGYIPQSVDAVELSPSASPNIPLISGVPSSPKQVRDKSSSDDSSSCGESGWSSSAGLSSLNTASFDAGTDDGLLPGSPDRRFATTAAAAGPWNAT
jgi:hypothetical protein